MDKEVEEEFIIMKKIIVDHNAVIQEMGELLDQHALVINNQKESLIQGAQEIGIQIKSIQEDMDKLFDLYHKLESLPNMLTVLQDFKKLDKKKDEKSKTN